MRESRAGQPLHEAETTRALARARAMSEPFLRAQALAHLAWHAGEGWERIVDEALAAAAEPADPFQRCAVLAWPLRVWLERGRPQRALLVVREALARATAIEGPLMRANACVWLWHAVVPYPGAARRALLEPLRDACLASRSWRGAVLLRDAALLLAPSDPQAAAALMAALPEGKQRRQGEERLARGEVPELRWFFDPAGSSVD